MEGLEEIGYAKTPKINLERVEPIKPKETVYGAVKRGVGETYEKAVKVLEKPKEALRQAGAYELKEEAGLAAQKGAHIAQQIGKGATEAYRGFQEQRRQSAIRQKEELKERVETAELKARLASASFRPRTQELGLKTREYKFERMQTQHPKVDRSVELLYGSQPITGGNPLGGSGSAPRLFGERPKGKPKWLEI